MNKCCRNNIDKILPPESLSRAKANGAFYESEFDEGWNACLEEINSRILNLIAFKSVVHH